jgi:hypothetical protein
MVFNGFACLAKVGVGIAQVAKSTPSIVLSFKRLAVSTPFSSHSIFC